MKPKTAENRQLALQQLVNRLVPEMHKNTSKCRQNITKLILNKHGASKIIDTFTTYHTLRHCMEFSSYHIWMRFKRFPCTLTLLVHSICYTFIVQIVL